MPRYSFSANVWWRSVAGVLGESRIVRAMTGRAETRASAQPSRAEIQHILPHNVLRLRTL